MTQLAEICYSLPPKIGGAKMSKSTVVKRLTKGFDALARLSLPERVEALNEIRAALSAYSPFAAEPVDCVQWVLADEVEANDYNPNSVAPPEMELLRLSIMADGYTQPIVANQEEGGFVVIDGFHRNRVGKECLDVRDRVHGYLPIVQIQAHRTDAPDRMASTIRHNRARGKHRVEAMSDIVLELKRRNWNDEKIGRELGMDPDEVLRLTQIGGLAEMFADREFSEAWEAGTFTEEDLAELNPDGFEDGDGER
jgi:ParB-like chromosome segregation protein Spo0J